MSGEITIVPFNIPLSPSSSSFCQLDGSAAAPFLSPPLPPTFVQLNPVLSTASNLLSKNSVKKSHSSGSFTCFFEGLQKLLSSRTQINSSRKMLKSRSRCIFLSGTLNSRGFDRRFSAQSKLEGKVALITGAASGIGKETATRFISQGAKVVIADIQHQCGMDLATELGSNASFFPCNVTKEYDISNAVDYVVSKYRHLDIMYNNAGVACHTPPSIIDLDLAMFDQVMAINVRGILAGIKHASRVMIPRQSGSILCTTSVTGLMGGLAPHTYSVSKSSVIGMVKSVASELCKHGIRINCISPFAIPTAFSIEDMSRFFPGVETQRLIEMIHNAGALKGAKCEPVDVANAALYLASDDAKYVTGHNLVVDGGFTSFKALEFPAPGQLQ
ncbi:hypothetical protein DCAR_0521005 [Daucus carota subsp. sativus]|uniref:Uncharacterized protein n=2 Tax=Daucus carota subsp. sativus TaxID=79200 RepID=A0AAF0X843_DAUCS|nr:hypothetical protein DCAR_0521005 [Daucus carota subsp. sativus]